MELTLEEISHLGYVLENLPRLQTELQVAFPIIYLGKKRPTNPIYEVTGGSSGNYHLVISPLGKKLIKAAEEIEKVVKIKRPKREPLKVEVGEVLIP